MIVDRLSEDRRLTLVDVGLALVAAILAFSNARGNVWPLVIVLVCVVSSPLVWPRIPAWLVLTAVLLALVTLNFRVRSEGAFFFPCIVVVDVVAREPRRRIAYALAAVAIVTPPLIRLTNDSGHTPNDWAWQFWTMGVALAAVLGWLLRRQARLTEALRSAQAQLADYAVADERRRIARDVHDIVGHTIAVVMLHVTGARRILRRDPSGAEEALQQAELAGRSSMSEIRQVIRLLRDGHVDGSDATVGGREALPALDDITTLVGRYQAGGIHVHTEIDIDGASVPATIGLGAYRVVQESLSNVARHAPGAPAHVRVARVDADVVVVVSNPTIHTVADVAPGNGITGMTERVASLGGELVAGPCDGGRRWSVEARLPAGWKR